MRIVTKLAIATAVLTLPAVVRADFAWNDGKGNSLGIVYSPHDLSNVDQAVDGNTVYAAPDNGGGGTNQICIFCHVPHKAESTQLVWNRALHANNYTWGNDLNGAALTATTAGTTLPAHLGPRSRTCLTCHDGTVSVGQVTNAGLLAGLNGIGTSITMMGADQMNGAISNPQFVLTNAAGTDLAGNHPISVPYPGSTYLGTASAVTGACDTIGNFWCAQANNACLSNSGVCTSAVPYTGNDANVDGTHINLVTDPSANTFGAGTTKTVGVECVSCHEPHNKFGNDVYLRVDNSQGSALCRSCHKK